MLGNKKTHPRCLLTKMHLNMDKKLNLSGHILCRMPDDRLMKQVVFEIMDGSNRRERPTRRWTNDRGMA